LGGTAVEPRRIECTLALSWNGGAAAARPGAGAAEPAGPIAAVARLLVANPDDLARWRIAHPPLNREIETALTDPRPLAAGAGGWGRLAIEQDGLYWLDPATLAGAGFDPTSHSLSSIRIFSEGRGVPLRVVDGDEADALGVPAGVYFYGWRARAPYARGRVYDVTAAPDAPAERYPVAAAADEDWDAAPRLDRIERHASLDRDRYLMVRYGTFMTIMRSNWADSKLVEGEPIALPLRLHDAQLPEDSSQTLTLRLRFATNGPPFVWTDTAARLSHDGRPLLDIDFGKLVELPEITAAVPVGMLRGAGTTLTLAVTRTTSTSLNADDEWGIWFDRADMDYASSPTLMDGQLIVDAGAVPRAGAYRLPRPGLARAIPESRLWALQLDTQGRRCETAPRIGDDFGIQVDATHQAAVFDLAAAASATLTPNEWRDALLHPAQAVDYLIVAPESFQHALAPLIEVNRARGLESLIVAPQDIYDHFSHGMLSPPAIRAFLAYGIGEWPGGGPSYVLFVGDATSDYLDQMRSGAPNLVPSYTFAAGDETWASDYWFTTLCGDDDLPDVMLSRLSVNNVEDLSAIVNKTVRYATQPAMGPWRARLGYLADNVEPDGDVFRLAAERLRTEMTPPMFDDRRIYVDDLPLEDNWYFETRQIEFIWQVEQVWSKVCGAASRALIETLNDGVAELDYFGHGSPNVWADERVWYGGDTTTRYSLNLKSDGRYAVIANFTCNSGAIDFPIKPWNICITEDLMRAPDGGAVAMFVPSGPGYTPYHLLMAGQWRRALFGAGLRGLGEIGMLARARYVVAGGPRSILYMYLMLGDPALKMQLTPAWHSLQVEPAVVRPGTDGGGGVSVRLAGVQPAHGTAYVWMEAEDGGTIGTSVTLEYRGGRLVATLPPPPATIDSPAQLTVRAYGWDDQTHTDWTASGQLRVASPDPRLVDARATRQGGGQARIALKAENFADVAASDLKVRVTRVDGAQRTVLSEEGLALGAHGKSERTVTVAANPPDRPSVYEVALVADHPADDLTQPATPSRRIVLPPEGTANDIPSDTTPGHSRLRIRPDSIGHLPNPVTDGETIWVHFTVENVGTAPSPICRPRLYDASPLQGGALLPVQSASQWVEVPSLGPGRSAKVTLRWDPVRNQGVQTIWIGLNPVVPPADDGTPADRVASYRLYVSSKSKLTIRQPIRITGAPGRLVLHCEIENEGETDAREVEVRFYLDRDKTPQNLIGTVPLARVPARGRADAQLVWNTNLQAFEIYPEMRLQGSRQVLVE
jgi:hypothetical protein